MGVNLKRNITSSLFLKVGKIQNKVGKKIGRRLHYIFGIESKLKQKLQLKVANCAKISLVGRWEGAKASLMIAYRN